MSNVFTNRHVLSLAGNGVMAVFSVLTYSLLYRFLAPADMGNWVFFQFSFLLLDTFRTGLLQTALIKFYAGADEARQRSVAGAGWLLALLVTGGFGLLNALAWPLMSWFTDAGVLVVLRWFGLALALTLPFNVATWVLQAEQRFDRILYIRLLNQGSFIGLIFGAFLLDRINLHTVMYAFLLSALLTSVVAVAARWSRLENLPYRTGAAVREIFHFGKYSFGTYLCANLLRSSDTFIIKFMLGPAALAVYNLPQRLLEILEIPLRSGLATAMPSMSAAVNRQRQGEVTEILLKYAGFLTLLFVPVALGAGLLAEVLVGLVGGGKYAGTEAATIYRIMLVSALLFPLERFLGVTLDIIGKPQLNLVKVLLALAVNVGADIGFIQLTGSVYGATLASVATMLASTVYGYVVLSRYLPLPLGSMLPLALEEILRRGASLFHKLRPSKS
ncbi:lipopolysaccharide biosynthesis protein [Hymenobacter metallicola]|uniref:Lipopolysaccharide biosynthesis protein n=1 Tax=Hymenobacter metallicola TaxID=2563114 RepID=A0A4Z0QF30_9BACT|nr:oligosaccharide flippase family protein [Hymenobacter metallicola]TGE28668.1 lipopolysaccharide biosynthesis protein [Hymenobacter metallicola]